MEIVNRVSSRKECESVCATNINIPVRYAGLFYTSIKRYELTDQILFQNTPIPPNRLHEQDFFIPFHDFLTFINNAIRNTGTEELAMDFGQSLVLPAHGTWGLAVMTSPTLYDAVMLFKEYVSLELPFFIFDFQEIDEHVIIEIKGTPAIEERLRFHLEYIVVAEALNLSYAIKDSSDLEIHCSYEEPSYGPRYRKTLGLDVTFNSHFTGARFHRKHLHVTMPDANHASHIMLRKTLEQSRVVMQNKTTTAQIIESCLGEVRFCYPGQEMMAEKLNMSARKLRHCLKEENTTYHEIVSNLKKRDASQCLNDGMAVSQVAFALGYEDPSNFARAFRKWYGVSPTKFCDIRQ